MATPKPDQLTHWKKLNNPDYLGAYAFNRGEEKTVTIASVGNEMVHSPDGKSEECLVAHFTDRNIKPMILNATNCKMITKLHKTPYIQEWIGKRIILVVRQVKAFGDIVDAVRVKPELPPERPKPIPNPVCADCGKPIQSQFGMDPFQLAEYTKSKFSRQLCAECAKKASGTHQEAVEKAAAEQAAAEESKAEETEQSTNDKAEETDQKASE